MFKDFVDYQTALKLKELGFDEPCFLYWWKGESGYILADIIYDEVRTLDFKAPLFQQAFRWFREEHELSHSIELIDDSRHYYYYFKISDSKDRHYIDEDCFDFCKTLRDDGKYSTYEEAELACLDKMIEIVELKNKDNEL